MRMLGIVLLVGCTAEVPGVAGHHDDPSRGSGSDTSSGGEQTSITLTDYFDDIAAIHCQQAFSCRASWPADRGYPFEDDWGTSVADCEQRLITAWSPKTVETEIAKGRITYDGSAAISCLSGVAFAACPDYWSRGIEWADACYHVVVGLVQAGGECESEYSCMSFMCDPTLHVCK